MKKIFIFIILVLFFSTSVNADWIFISKSNDGSEFYIDNDNIRKEGSTRYFWILMNLTDKKVDRNYNSTLAFTKVDCTILRAKDLKFFTKTLQMGKGEIASEFNPPDEWKYPLPGSNQEAVYKTVCDL